MYSEQNFSTRLFYIYDPMCSWCYAFHSNWLMLQNSLPASIQIVYLLGGLAPDSDVPMPFEMRHKIQKIWRHIEHTVPGVYFNHDFWIYNTPVRSTYPACRAILAARAQGQEFGLDMLQAIQVNYYQEAKNPALQAVLRDCAIEIGLDGNQFDKDFTSDKIEQKLQDEIQQARDLGANTFPTLCLVHNNEQFPVMVDYSNWETMLNEILAITNGA